MPLARGRRGARVRHRWPSAGAWRSRAGRDGIIVINDAYNASPDSTAAALKTLAQIRRPARARSPCSARWPSSGSSRARSTTASAGSRCDSASRSSSSWARARATCTPPPVNEGSWDGESAYVADTADEAYDLLREHSARPGDVVLVKSSNVRGSPPPRRPTGRMVRVSALLIAAGVVARLHAVPDPALHPPVQAPRLGAVHPRRRAHRPTTSSAERPRWAASSSSLGSLFGYFASTLLVSERAADHLGDARARS